MNQSVFRILRQFILPACFAISEETLFNLVTKQLMQTPAAPEKKEAAKGKEALIG